MVRGVRGRQFKIGWSEEENKMAEDWVDVEHVFLHGYIRNTPSDNRSACRTPAESRQEYLTSGKEYIESCKTR